jgi:hypothetical protein
MKRRDIIFLAVIGIGIVTLLGSCSSAGAGEDGGGGGGAPESPTDLGDPTEPGGELLDEELNELLVAEEEGGSFTIHVRDRATGDAITEDVTVNVQNGTATAVDANGVFTVTPTSDDILRLQVLVPGYTVYTYTDYDSGTGINYVEKEPLDSRVFGEWILYKVVDASTQEEYAVYDESVTFRPDGSVSWEGARVYGNPDYYYSTVPAENGNVGFGQTSSIAWVSLNSSPSRPEFYRHVGLLNYLDGDDILSMFAIGPTAPDVRLYYSRDGLDPDGGDATPEVGSGSFTFQGTTYEGLAARTDFLDSWTIVPTDGTYTGVYHPGSTIDRRNVNDRGRWTAGDLYHRQWHPVRRGIRLRHAFGRQSDLQLPDVSGDQNRSCRGLADRPDDRARGRYDRDSPSRIIRGYRRTRRVCFAGDSGPLHGR